MRKFVQTLFIIFTLFWGSVPCLAQVPPQICIQRGSIPGIASGNDNDLVVTIDGLSSTCIPQNATRTINVQTPSSLGGFVFNPTEKFSADSISTAKFSSVPVLSLPNNLEGVIWVVDIRNQASSTGGRIIRCKSIEVVRQKEFQASLTECSETSGIFQITPASAFAGSSTRFSVIGLGVNQGINNALLAGQSINFPSGTSISSFDASGGLRVVEEYFFSNGTRATCPPQFVRVKINRTQPNPRIISLDRSSSDTEVELRLENINPDIPYAIDRGPITGGRSTILPSSTQNPIRVPMGEQENACFSVSVPSVCVSGARLTSNVVCSSWLTGELEPIAGSSDYLAQLAWTRLASPQPINQEDIVHGSPISLIPPRTEPKFPKFTTCAGPFDYRIRQTYQTTDGFSVIITSNTLNLNPANGVTPPKDKLFVSMAQDASPRVEVNVSSDSFGLLSGLYFEQKLANGTFQSVNLGKNPNFAVNVSNDPSGAHCFRYGREVCGFKSPPTPENCVLQNTLENDFVLSWKPFDGSPTTSSSPIYRIQFSNKEIDPTFSTPSELTPTQNLSESLREMFSREPRWSQFLVRVYTTNTVLGNPSYAFPVEVIRPLALHLPNAFTPNGDEKNDFFRIENAFTGTGYMRIYNRLGQVIFQTEDLDLGWSGQNNQGTFLPAGMYQYEVQVINSDGQTWKRVGSVFLIR